MMKILAIDDNLDNLVVLKAMLKTSFPDFTFFAARSGEEGLSVARDNHPDLILLDLVMPGMDGYEICKLIKEDADLQRIPVIILTAERTDASSRIRALQLGADSFLLKPVMEAELIALVSTMVRVKQSEDQIRLEKLHLENTVTERTRSLQLQLEELRKTERELKESYTSLETTKLASLNLMEDLKAEVDQRKHSERVLQESEKKFKDLSILFRSISDNMMDMLWAKDKSKRYIFANKSVCENLLFAKDTEEPIGKDDLFFALRQRNMHPDNPDWHTFGEICKDSDQVVLDAGKPQKFDEFGNVEGKFLFLDVRKSPLYNLDGELIGTVGSAQDRTAEREMSKQLAQRERQLSTLVSNLPGMVYRSMDGYDGRMFFVSDGCFNVSGYTKEQFLDEQSVLFNDLILEEFRDDVVDRWQKVLSLGEMFEGEYPIKNANGEVRWVWERCRGEYDEKGQIQYVEGYIEDITDRKKATESLRESEQRYETFINSIDDFAFLKDENFRYLFINNANAIFFGKAPEDIIGKDDFELMEYDYAQKCRENDQIAIKNSHVWISEEIIDGNIYETRKFPVKLSNGRTGVGGYIRDISDRKAAEIQINKLNNELEQRVLERTAQLVEANKELEAFSYSVSHDLRAPLRALDGFTRILFDEYRESFNDEGKRICSIIQDNAVKMGQLIDALLALSRLNRQDLHLGKIDMKQLALSAFDETMADANNKTAVFFVNDLHPAKGDQGTLKQVLINLIGNAVKFSSKCEKAEITMTSSQNNDTVVYCIKDNGAGFDMKYADKLFGAFQRLHSVKEFEGNGIGLAIVQRIIHRHGGSVWAESEVGKGAAFYFSLPLKVEKNA